LYSVGPSRDAADVVAHERTVPVVGVAARRARYGSVRRIWGRLVVVRERLPPLSWLRAHDRELAALRRAGRTALIMPLMFAFGDRVLDDATLATFAAFGSFAMLLLVDFTGPIRDRLKAQVALAVVSGAFVCLGTLASQTSWLAATTMALVAFGVLFAGAVSSVLASATTTLLLAFILPVSLPGTASSIPDRLAGWSLAAGASVLAIALLWPAPARNHLRAAASAACRALAVRLSSEVALVLGAVGPESRAGDRSRPSAAQHAEAVTAANRAVEVLNAAFFATPYRPTGLSTSARTLVRLVDELKWLDGIVAHAARRPSATAISPRACAVKSAAAGVLELSADLLDNPRGDTEGLRAALDGLHGELAELERTITLQPEIGDDVVSALDPGFRAQELSFVVAEIAHNVDLAAAAERRSWPAQLLGRQPGGIPGRLSVARAGAGAHAERHSLWLQNSVRGAAGLGLAVLVANLSGVQHGFWVVFGTLSVLRSSALNTGQNVVRGLLGTTAGFVVGAAVVALVGTNTTLLWVLLPPAVLLAGLAPATVSFAAGQAAFTLTLLILFNILQPAGWQIGLVRIEDVALGGGVSLLVGLMFWPRGTGAALGIALAEAYVDTASYLARAVEFGMGRCDLAEASAPPPTGEAKRAAGASRRLDDTFRSYLSERGAKPARLAEVASLITAQGGLRLAADSVLDLWQHDDPAGGDRTLARAELLATATLTSAWYDEFAASLTGDGAVPEPQDRDELADRRLVAAVANDLSGEHGEATATAVRMIWTGDHLDAARRLQRSVVGPARAVLGSHPGRGHQHR
jgi:uncharacterized membrane protein YccC